MADIRRVAIVIDLQWPVPHHLDVYAGIHRYARQHGNWECMVDLHAGEKLPAGRGRPVYDGIIARATPRLVARARRAHVPVVNVWLNSPAKSVPSVLPDIEASGRMAAAHLMSRGLRQFAHLGYLRERATQLQAAGFREVIGQSGFTCSSHLVWHEVGKTPASWKKLETSLERWIDSWPRPVGVCVSSDLLARYLADICQRNRVRVPDDVALVSTLNHQILCLNPEPAISSIELGFEEVGRRAAELLDRMMAGERPPRQPILVAPVELVARQSTDVFAVSDPVVGRAMRFIAEHSSESISVLDVAHHVQASRRNLERRFRDALGRTIIGEIARLRIESVKRRLVETDESLKHVAAQLGFRSVRRLCEAFRRVEGMTPGEFRRLRRKSAEA